MFAWRLRVLRPHVRAGMRVAGLGGHCGHIEVMKYLSFQFSGSQLPTRRVKTEMFLEQLLLLQRGVRCKFGRRTRENLLVHSLS